MASPTGAEHLTANHARRTVAVALAAVLMMGWPGGQPAGAEEPRAASAAAAPALRLRTVASGLADPVFVTAPRGDRRRLFVVEQRGTIRVVRNGRLLRRPFLDLRALTSAGGERGLLGLAFHPRYARNGRFFVHYTNTNGDTRVAEYRRSSNPDRAVQRRRRMIFRTDQPYSNHNGGMLTFGPDGMLYLAMGDGGGAGDPHNHGQRRTTPLGAILRFDVGRRAPYIPPDNPWADGRGGHPAVWAYGLRNPWRFSFDHPTRRIYVADVGQSSWEEVNVAPASRGAVNYGWRVMEGNHCYAPPSGCDTAGLRRPVLEYGRSDGCSVTGGYVYRGRAIPALRGHYFYGDFCNGWIRSFVDRDGEATARRDWSRQLGSVGGLTSFGTDGSGELYVTSLDGTVRRIEGVATPLRWLLRNRNRRGRAHVQFAYGRTGDVPLVGDWDGDGIDTPGVFRRGRFLLSNDPRGRNVDRTFRYGSRGDRPLVGDWNRDGRDTIGVVRGNRFFLANRLGGRAIHDFRYGNRTDRAITGDWDHDGRDTIGVVRGNRFFLANRLGGRAIHDFRYGNRTDRAITGDWNRDGRDTIGVARR